MSHTYRAIGWNPQKRAYDAIAIAGAITTAAIVAIGTLTDEKAAIAIS